VPPPTSLNEPVTRRMHQQFTRLRLGQTVGDALAWLRDNPPPGRVIYFYVVDDDNRLRGVLPTRRLLLSRPETQLAEIMVAKTVSLPAAATVLDACEFFIQHRLLAFPVVDEESRLIGVVDIDLYTNELAALDSASPVARLVEPLVRFLRVESSGGIILLACTVLSLVLANIPAVAGAYEAFWQTHVDFGVGGFRLDESLLHWINDGLMALFFLVVGLEIKREVVSGELSDPRKALLPVVAAVGGMVVPAGLYALGLWGRPGLHGWGVPMATDIAFVVGFLTLLGPRVPNGLKVLLLTLAIADDIGSVLVIAFAYSGGINFLPLGLALVGLALVPLLWWLGIRNLAVYVLLAAAVWLGFFESHVHSTVAGVLLGLLTPARPDPRRRVPLDAIGDLYARLRGIQRGTPPHVEPAASPVELLEEALHPWVAFVIMPVFALANAEVRLGIGRLATPIALAVVAGLVLGKPLGIVLFSWAAVRAQLTRLPDGLNWKVMIGAGCLGGIGFTMSLFIAGLAFEDDARLLDEAKVGVLAGSATSALFGCLLLLLFLRPPPARQ
jgi:NhaA family Na+:H+ antiporter